MKSVAENDFESNASSRFHCPSANARMDEDECIGRLVLSAFSTPLGWMGLLGQDGQLVSVFVGRATSKSIQTATAKFAKSADDDDWNPEVRRMLEAYAEGEIIDFSSIEIQLPPMTGFRQQVMNATRRLRYGETVTYGDLAQRVGHPRAARAVGTVMSANRFPIVIPCHRVLASGGKLGGYTSPAGTNLKRRMLDLEGCSRLL